MGGPDLLGNGSKKGNFLLRIKTGQIKLTLSTFCQMLLKEFVNKLSV